MKYCSIAVDPAIHAAVRAYAGSSGDPIRDITERALVAYLDSVGAGELLDAIVGEKKVAPHRKRQAPRTKRAKEIVKAVANGRKK